MNTELTEEEMRRALFGPMEVAAPAHLQHALDGASGVVILPLARKKYKNCKPTTPKLRVTLRVGNEFEGRTESFSYDADTLSTLLAEQEATKAARKNFKYVEVVSITPAR